MAEAWSPAGSAGAGSGRRARGGWHRAAAGLAAAARGGRGARSDGVLDRGAIARVLGDLLRTDAAAFARRHDDDPARVRMLAPGALLLGAILDRYGLASTRVSPHGLREGVLLAALADPDGWWFEPAS